MWKYNRDRIFNFTYVSIEWTPDLLMTLLVQFGTDRFNLQVVL